MGRAMRENGGVHVRTAVYPGSFDPPTLGHLNIIRRAAAIFDELVVCVMRNGAKECCLFTCEERAELLRESTAGLPNVRVDTHTGLLTDYVRESGSPVVIRGLRAVTDFEYEFQMAAVNRKLNPEMETVFMFAGEEFAFLSSSAVRELARFKSSLRDFVPAPVERAVREKISALEAEQSR